MLFGVSLGGQNGVQSHIRMKIILGKTKKKRNTGITKGSLPRNNNENNSRKNIKETKYSNYKQVFAPQ